MKISISIFFLNVKRILFSQKTLIRGAHIHVGNGNVIEKGLLGIDGDRIVLVKKRIDIEY